MNTIWKMRAKLIIIGAGSFATEIEEMARLQGYEEIAFLDDNAEGARCNPVIGKLDDISKFKNEYSDAIVAFGNNEMRMKYHKLLIENGYNIPVLIHPTAYVSPDAEIESGCIVRAMSVVGRYVKLGQATILNIGAKIDHDCIIGEGTHVLVGAVVRNKVSVEPMTWINANQVIE